MPTTIPQRGAVYVYDASTLTVRAAGAIQLVKHPHTQPSITLQPINGVASRQLERGIYKVLPAPLPAQVTLETSGNAESAIFSVKDPPPNPTFIDEFRRVFGDPQAILDPFFPPVPGAKGAPEPLDEAESVAAPAGARSR